MAAQRTPQQSAKRCEQPRRDRQSAIVALIAGLTILYAAPALRADMIPPTEIQALFQEKQDVRIRVVVPYADSQTESNVNTIVRGAGAAAHTVVENVSLTEADADNTLPACTRYNFSYTIQTSDFCAEFPSECLSCLSSDEEICIGLDCDTCVPVGDYFFPGSNEFYQQHHKLDCDTDGEAECLGTCDGRTYDFWDTCVPPGTVEYRLMSDGQVLDTQTIEVVDAEIAACVPDIDTDGQETDTGPLDNGDSDGDQSGPKDSDPSGNDGAPESEPVGGCTVLPAASSPGLFQLLIQLL